MSQKSLMGIGAVLFLLMILTALLSGDPQLAIPIALVALLAFGFWGLFVFNQRRVLRSHGGDVGAAMADDQDGIPSTAMAADDATALGDNPELHSEISPHDYPAGSPERHAVEALAAEEGGTTAGHRDPTRRGERIERAPGAEEGYPEGDVSSPRGKQAGGGEHSDPGVDPLPRGTLNQP